MSYVKRSYRDAVEDILTQLTKGVIREHYDAEANRAKYALSEKPVKAIVKIEGTLGGNPHTFKREVDYRLASDAVEWLPRGARPDDNTPFFVNYSFGEPSGITDVNPGSVSRTLVEAIAREFEFLYSEMENVYNSAFIDTAKGSALDLVVSILGVARLPPQHAVGPIIFGRETDPDEITVNAEAHLYDGRPSYELKTTPVKSIQKLEGSVKEASKPFEQGKDYKLDGNSVLWLEGGARPDEGTPITVNYTSFQRIIIPLGTRISTYSKQPENVRELVTIEEKTIERLPNGHWEAQIRAKASTPGKAGNVPAGSVTVMPHPPVGVEFVINREDISTGTDAESDEELRGRAKKALEAAGKATLISLESAVRRVEGVKTLRIEDTPDGVPGIVRVTVDGGDTEAVENAINDTRSAGIKVEFSRPKIAQIDVALTVLTKRGASAAGVQKNVETKVRDYIGSLQIGEEIVFNRVTKAALDVDEVYDILGLSISVYPEGLEPIISTVKNISMRTDERANARTVSVSTKGREIEATE
jgi:uncharacterized phage protein gp47/JayE